MSRMSDHTTLCCADRQDDNPASLVAGRLRRSGYPFLRSIKCEFRGGVTILSGTVPTFHLKQIAQALASHTPGVGQIENCVHVTSPGARCRDDMATG
jgi:osmotically-inducible protein OsmY